MIEPSEIIDELWQTAQAMGYEKVRIDRAVIGNVHKPLVAIEIGYGSGTVRLRVRGQDKDIWDVYDIDTTDNERAMRQLREAQRVIARTAGQIAGARLTEGPGAS